MSGDKGYDFISVQVDHWDSPWQNRHGFLWELAKRNRVFFLAPPFYVVDLIRGTTRTKLHGLSLIKANLYSYTPPRYLPVNYRFEVLDKVLADIRQYVILQRLKRLNFERPVLIIWHPKFVDMIGKFNEALVVYYKYDHYAGYIGGGGTISRREKELLGRADITLVTSKGLYELHKEDCKELHVVPNGVDFDFFARSLTDEVDVAPDIEVVPKPRIGYVGVINEKVDFKLLLHLCRSRPDWSIVLVGPVRIQLPEFRKDFGELERQKNCYVLGQKENRAVPSYIKGLDVCMMCYLVNEWTYYGYPLKMHEYLACGKPSVSADLPEVTPYSDVIRIARNREEWIEFIGQELRYREEDDVSRRLIVAQNNSWTVRVDEAVRIIEGRGHRQV